MDRDRERLHQAGVLGTNPVCERHDALGRDPNLVRHSPVSIHAERAADAGLAQLIGAGATELAGAAGRGRLNRHGRVVVEQARELVTDRVRQQTAREHQQI